MARAIMVGCWRGKHAQAAVAKTAGHEVTISRSVTFAQQAILRHVIDILIVGWNAAAAELLTVAAAEHIPVIVIAESVNLAEAYETASSADVLLESPVNKSDLIALINGLTSTVAVAQPPGSEQPMAVTAGA